MRKGEVTVRVEALRALRARADSDPGTDGISQLELSVRASKALRALAHDDTLNISESLIALIETGRRQPSRQNIEAIAVALNVAVSAIADVVAADAENGQ